MKNIKITAEDISKKVFGTELSGYKMEAVNSFLDEIVNQMLDLEQEIKEMTKELEELRFSEKKLRVESSDYQKKIHKISEEKKALTQEKLSDFDIIKAIQNIQISIAQINKKIENNQ